MRRGSDSDLICIHGNLDFELVVVLIFLPHDHTQRHDKSIAFNVGACLWVNVCVCVCVCIYPACDLELKSQLFITELFSGFKPGCPLTPNRLVSCHDKMAECSP